MQDILVFSRMDGRGNKMMPAYLYKKYISEMVEKIDEEKDLERIFCYVHRRFINQPAEQNQGVCNECGD